MNRKSIVSLFVFLAAFCGAAFGQAEKPAPPAPPEKRVLTEQQVFVPFDKMDEALAARGQGVFIPHSDFLTLWEEATRKEPDPVPPVPPVDAAVVSASYEGTVEDEVVRFRGKLRISALKKEWGRLRLEFGGVALTSISLDGEPPLMTARDGGVELILPKKGDFTLAVDFSARVESLPGKKRVRFNLPPCPLSKMTLSIPGSGLDVKIDPMLSLESEEAEGQTRVSAFLPPDGRVNLEWLVKAEKKKAESLIFSRLFSHLHIRESVYTLDTRIDFSVMQAGTDTLSVKIPGGQSLVRVEGENIKGWDVSEEGILEVRLYEEIEGPYRLALVTEQYRETGETLFDYPALEVPGARREEGVIAVSADPALRVKVERAEKVSQVDPSEIRRPSPDFEPIYSCRYFRHPFSLQLGISKIEPRVRARQEIRLSFLETLIELDCRIHYTIEEAGLFELGIRIPDGFRVVRVGDPSTVESHSVEEKEDERILRVILKNRALGNRDLPVVLEADRGEENRSVALPRVACVGAEKQEGVIAIFLRDNLKLSTSGAKGLRPVSLDELRTLGFRPEHPETEPAAGYRFATRDYALTLSVEKRRTRLIATVLRTVAVEETALKTTDRIRYRILYAPENRFRVEVPAETGREAHWSGEGIKEKRFLEGEEGKGVWEIELHSPKSDRFDLTLQMEQKIPEIRAGEKHTVHIPVVRALDVFNESGFVSVVKSPTLQVDAGARGLEPIDVKELPAPLARNQSALAFKYLSHPYRLSLEMLRHDYEKVLSAIVTHAHFDIVLSEEGIGKTEAVYRIRNSNRQSLEIEMPPGIENIYSVFVSGRKSSISKGVSDTRKVLMLPKDIPPGQEFTVRMIYQTRIRGDFGFSGALDLRCAEIRDVPVLKINWRLYLPAAYSYPYLEGTLHPRKKHDDSFENIGSFLRSKRVVDSRAIQVDAQQIRRQNDESGLAGLDVDLVREGRLFEFSKLDGDARLKGLYVKNNVLYPVCVLVFLAAAWAGWIRGRVGIALFPAAFVKPLAALYLVQLVVPQGFRFLVWLVFWGIFCSGVVRAFLAYRSRRDTGAATGDAGSSIGGVSQ
jgi:hypothetical protein